MSWLISLAVNFSSFFRHVSNLVVVPVCLATEAWTEANQVIFDAMSFFFLTNVLEGLTCLVGNRFLITSLISLKPIKTHLV